MKGAAHTHIGAARNPGRFSPQIFRLGNAVMDRFMMISGLMRV